MKSLQGNILIENKFFEAEISFEEKIVSIKKIGPQKNDLQKIIPGFIDLHVHGGGGHDVMEGTEEAFSKISKIQAKFGTTSFLATTMTATKTDIVKTFQALKKNYHLRGKGQSRLLGVHLEGPFINSKKLGAQPDFTREGTIEEIDELCRILPIKILTLSPEVFNHFDLIKKLKEKMVIQIGHTNGSYEDAVKALKCGAQSFTHLFNAMTPLHHREPGVVGAALAHAEFSELIPDLIHVHPGALKVALRSIPFLYFVSDATAATGMPDGEYKLGTQKVSKCLGGVRLKDGTLAGSCLTLDQALRNLVGIGIPLEEVSRRLSEYPAKLIQLNDRGLIKENYCSDLVILNEDLTLKQVFVEGEEV